MIRGILQRNGGTQHSDLSKMADQMPFQPRLLTKAQAAAYMATTSRNYDRLRKAGIVPGYVPGMHRVDRLALDAAIDRLSDVSDDKPPKSEADPLAMWSREARAARRAAETQSAKSRIPSRTRGK